MIKISSEEINIQEVIAAVRCPGAGAIATFDGTVRNHARGKKVTHLFYEAYEKMATTELESIREKALHRWPLRELAAVHRTGRLEIGDSSVFIAVSSDHRADAFEACRFVIDSLKRRVPIWKKEFYADGEIWVEGYADHVPGIVPAETGE